MPVPLRRTPEPKSATLPTVRENQAVLDRFAEHVRCAGVSESDALRQMLRAYLRWPFTNTPAIDGPLDGFLSSCRIPQPLATAIQAQAAREGVSVGELVRRVVRRQVRAGASQ